MESKQLKSMKISQLKVLQHQLIVRPIKHSAGVIMDEIKSE